MLFYPVHWCCQHRMKVNFHHITGPGMRTEARLKENPGAAEIELRAEEYAAICAEPDLLTVHGDRTGLTRLASVPKSTFDQGTVYRQ